MKLQPYDRDRVQDRTLSSLRFRLSSHLEDWALLAIQLHSPDAARCQHAAGGMFLGFRPLLVLTRRFLRICSPGGRRTPRGNEILALLEEIRILFRSLRRGGKLVSNKAVYHQLCVASEDMILLLREELAGCCRVVPFVAAAEGSERAERRATAASAPVVRFPVRGARSGRRPFPAMEQTGGSRRKRKR